MGFECNICEDSGYVSEQDRLPWPLVERKAAQREAWRDLPQRLTKVSCPACQFSVIPTKPEPPPPDTPPAPPPPAKKPKLKKRKYTKRAKKWFK